MDRSPIKMSSTYFFKSFHRVAVPASALQAKGLGFKPQRIHILNSASFGSLCGLQKDSNCESPNVERIRNFNKRNMCVCTYIFTYLYIILVNKFGFLNVDIFRFSIIEINHSGAVLTALFLTQPCSCSYDE